MFLFYARGDRVREEDKDFRGIILPWEKEIFMRALCTSSEGRRVNPPSFLVPTSSDVTFYTTAVDIPEAGLAAGESLLH